MLLKPMSKYKKNEGFPRIIDKIVNWRLDQERSKLEKSHIKFSLNETLEFDKEITKTQAIEKLPKLSINKYRLLIDRIKKNGFNYQDLKMYLSYRDQLPLDIFGFAYGLKSFKSTQQRLMTSKNKLKAGFYFIELGAKITEASAKVKLSLSNSENKQRPPLTLKLYNGDISKRMFYLESDDYLMLTLNGININDIFHIKLIRIIKNFFIDRACKKIGALYSRAHLKKLSLDDDLFEHLLAQYNMKFEDTFDQNYSYDKYIREHEKQTTPPKEVQLKNIQKWKTLQK